MSLVNVINNISDMHQLLYSTNGKQKCQVLKPITSVIISFCAVAINGVVTIYQINIFFFSPIFAY